VGVGEGVMVGVGVSVSVGVIVIVVVVVGEAFEPHPDKNNEVIVMISRTIALFAGSAAM
jgi:hypothetical protein